MLLDAVSTAVRAIASPYQVTSQRLGASKIRQYLTCPLSYKLKYIDKVPGRMGAPAALGSAIHAVIAQAHRYHWGAIGAGFAAEMLEAIWDKLSPEDADAPDTIVAFKAARDVWLPWYLTWSQDQRTLAVEERWEATVPDTDVALTGTVDRVYLEGPAVVVSDVKSGERAPRADKLGTDLQLSLYSWAMRQAGTRDTWLEIVHLRSQTPMRTSRSDEYLESVIQGTVLPVAEAIKAGRFPANPEGLYGCGFCDVQHACPIGRPEGNTQHGC